MAPPSGRARYRDVASEPAFRRLLPALAVSALGDGMSAVTLAVLALDVAGRGNGGLVIGLAVAAYTLPGALGTVVFGRPARRLPPARLVAADATLRAAALGVIPILYAVGRLTAVAYILLLGVSSLLHAWGLAGRYVLIAERLPVHLRLTANALVSVIDEGALIAGPLVAGLVIAAAGPATALAVDAGSFAVLALAAASVSVTRPPAAAEPGVTATRGAGWRVVAGHPALLGLLAMTWFYFGIYGPVEVALPLRVIHDLGGSAALLSAYWAALGAGSVVGALLTGWARHVRKWPALLAAVVGWGMVLVPIGLVHSVPVGLVCFGIGGLLYGPYAALSAALLQEVSPPRLLAQAYAARSALVVMATPVGAALGGPLTSAFGAGPTLVWSAIATITLGVVSIAVVLVRTVRARPLRA